MTILDGKKISNDIKDEIAEEVKKMKANGEKVPHLAAVIVGNDGASLTCLLYTSPSPRDKRQSRMPSSA